MACAKCAASASPEVSKDSPAEKAGLRKDDVIVRFDGESVTSVRKLTRLINESSADQNVRITVMRGGAEQRLTATLGKQKFENVFRTNTPNIWRRGDNDDSVRSLSERQLAAVARWRR
jgi:C-terminal processing protease CtpA/Prc